MPINSASVEWQWPTENIVRGNRRAAVSLPAFVRFLGLQHSARVHNLSRGGAMIETAARIYVGATIQLSCGTIDTTGTIVWQRNDRFGVKFLSQVEENQVVQQLYRSDAAADRRRKREATSKN